MDWTSFTECFLDSCRARGRALLTVATYRADLNAFGAWYEESTGAAPDPIAITSLDVAEYRSWLHRRWKPATTNRRLAVVKAAFTWAAGEGLVTASPAAQVRPVAAERPGPRSVDGRTLSALLREAQRAGSARDVALITLLCQTGLRIAEALALRWSDLTIRERSGVVVVRKGKGARYREVPLSLTARRALETWRKTRWPDQTPAQDAPVFPGRAGAHPLTSRAAQQAFARYVRRAGLQLAVTPHTLRHTFAKRLVDEGVSLDRVAALAGHASLSTTARYTRPTAADLEQAVSKLDWV